MNVKQLKEMLEHWSDDTVCVFAEYDKDMGTRLWYLGVCCNTEHQQKEKQLWFNRGFLVQKD